MGMTLQDISNANIGELMDIMITHQNMMDEVNDQSNVKEGTQEDLNAFFGI